MYRKYYSMNDMPRIVQKSENIPQKCVKKSGCETKEGQKIFGSFEIDDVILGIVILAVLLDDADDTLLLLALFAVFFSGHL